MTERSGGPNVDLLGRLGLTSRFAKEGAWLAGSQVLGAVAALAAIRVMTELLSPDEFGRLTLLVGGSTLAFGLAVRPLLQSVLRFYADWKRRGDGELLRAAAVVAVGAVTFAACALIATVGWWFGPALGQPAVTGLQIAALFVAEVVRTFEQDFFNAARRQKQTAFISAADACARPLLAVAAVLVWGPSADVALAGYAASSALVILATRALTNLEGSAPRPISRGMRFLRSERGRESARLFIDFSLPVVPLALLGWFNGVGDRYIIGGTIGVAEAGLYSAAYGLVSRPFLMLSSTAELLMRPILLDAIASGDPQRLARAKRAWLGFVGLGSAVGAILFFLLAPLVSRIFLAVAFRSVENLMVWIALGYLFFNLSSVYMAFCFAFRRTRSVLTLSIASSVAMVVVLIPLLELHALLGAAIAVPFYFGLQWALSYRMARKAEIEFRGVNRMQASPG